MFPEDDDTKTGLLDEETDAWDQHVAQQQSRTSRAILIPWILSIFFFCTTLLLTWQLYMSPSSSAQTSCGNGTYETGFSTDFASGPPGIPLRIARKKFTNDLYFNSTSRQFYNAPLSSNETTYIGVPSPEIDRAWYDLLHDQYVAISESEAQQFPLEHRSPISYNGEEEHFYFELSVFHNLHCLNEIRKAMAIDHDYYHGSEDSHSIAASREHIDHCIDQLRQAVQCHADLTPVPMLPAEGEPAKLFIGNGEQHTCRDFEAVREWVRERGQKARALGDY